jgi:membrane fusion protein, multidrug efflux system
MRKPIFFSVVLAGLVIAGGVYVETGEGHAAMPAPPPPAIPVNVAAVAEGDVPIALSGLGRVQPFNEVTVRPQVAGEITGIDYKQGRTVQKGALLVQIDPRPFQAKLDQANANLERDEAHLANAQTDLERYRPLARNGYVSAQQAETQASMVAQAKAAVAADKAVIEQDQLSLDYASVKSPITGVAGLRQVDIGNFVQPSDTMGLLTVTQVQPIAVNFTLPQEDLPDVQARMQAAGAGNLTVVAYSQDGTRKLGTGRLTVINNTVDAANGTITLRAVFPNRSRMLWPGEFVQARLILDTVHDGLTVPAPVVQRGPQGSYAWVLGPGDTAQVRPVAVTQMVDGKALIASGLKAGESVVSDGQYGLTPGARVSIQPSSADATSPLQNAQTQMLGIQP